MIAICIKPTKRLVKGGRYEIEGLWNSGTSQRWIEGKVAVKGLGRFSVNYFTDTSGNPLPKILIQPNYRSHETLDFKDLKVGDILVCRSESYKTLATGAKYQIELLEEVPRIRKGISSSIKYSEKMIKFVGISRKLKFNSWSFRKLSPQESREISLTKLFGEGEVDIIKTKVRKIDLATNKERVLLEILLQSISDRNRHILSVVDWACQKVGTKWAVKPEDFTELMQKSLGDIINKID